MSSPAVTLIVAGSRLVLGNPRPAPPPSSVVRYVEGDLQPDLVFELTGQDLAQFASITLRVRRDDGKLIARAATVDDAAAGKFHFSWAAGDLVRGRHAMEIEFVSLGGSNLTIPSRAPILLDVRADIA